MPKCSNGKLLSNTTYFSDNLGTYIANGKIQTNQITLNGPIINGSNSITFTENTLYTNIPQNFFINGTGLIKYQGVNYNIGQVIAAFVGGGTVAPYPSITYDASLNETTFTGNLVFPATSISASAILFPSTQVFTSIRLNNDLILNNGTLTITNAQLQLIPNISTLNTKTTNISFAGSTTTFGGSNTFTNAPTMSGANISVGSIPINRVSGTAVNTNGAQNIVATKTFTVAQTFQNNIRLDGSLLCGTSGGTIILNSTLEKINFLSNITSDINTSLTNLSNDITTNANNITTNTNNITTNTNNITTNTNSINTLNTKTTDINYSASNTTIVNTTNVSDLLISLTINGFSKGDFNNVITQCSSLSSNCQNQINDAINKANSAQNKADTAKTTADNAQGTANTALALATTANGLAVGAGALAATANTSATTANATNVAQQTAIDDLEIDVLALQTKTTQITYNSATGRTSVIDTLYCPFLEIGSLESGFTQTSTDQITLAGLLRCNNRVEVNNTLELVNNNNIIVEGIINQDNANPPNSGVNQFLAPTNFNGNCIFTNATTTINATTTQIGTNAVSTLNCNATAEFGGDITMSSAKNLRLKNIVPILLNDIYFGGEAGVHLNDDVVFNMKIEANRPVQISNTCQIGTSVSRNTLTSYNTTTILDSNTGMTLTTPVIGITSPSITIGQNGVTVITINGSLVQIGQVAGINYLYGSTYVQNLFSTTGVIGAVGNVFQQFI
jgi:hypothetical protein